MATHKLNPATSQANTQDVGHARQMWAFFTRYAKISAIFCAVLVAFVIWIIQ